MTEEVFNILGQSLDAKEKEMFSRILGARFDVFSRLKFEPGEGWYAPYFGEKDYFYPWLPDNICNLAYEDILVFGIESRKYIRDKTYREKLTEESFWLDKVNSALKEKKRIEEKLSNLGWFSYQKELQGTE